MARRPIALRGLFLLCAIAAPVHAQPLGQPDRQQPGDRQIQEYLARKMEAIHQRFLRDIESLDGWKQNEDRYRQEYLYMLGLEPLPERTPLQATVTGSLSGEGFVVDMLHFQCRPRLYVTANLYRPADPPAGQRLPAVLYVCGHSGRGRNGNKTAFQSHGIWFARHGYICLIVDTLQLGEIAAIHHGTYREQRWWWHARGYTPAGVECWNGIRAIDYLVGRDDVDPRRIAVTGISGGGAATFWIAAADPRVAVAVPISGMADLPSYVPNRVINGHCDCMFLYNTFQWPWTRIAALVAPRPLLYVNSDQDPIFPMDANQRVINRLESVYSLFGQGDQVDSVVSIGGHAYRRDIRQATYRFINAHLKNDPAPISDSEVDLVSDSGNSAHPIPPERLRVFVGETDIPADQLNTTIDQHFVPQATVELPAADRFDSWKAVLLDELRRVTFADVPQRVHPAKVIQKGDQQLSLETEPGIEVTVRSAAVPDQPAARILLVVNSPDRAADAVEPWFEKLRGPEDQVYQCDVRGVGATRWTSNNPPNYVERSHVLLGLTVDAGRVGDIAAVARYLRGEHGGETELHVVGAGRFGLLAAYAALLEPDIAGVWLRQPPSSHMDSDAPQLLNILRVCDVPEMLGMLAPKRLLLVNADGPVTAKVDQIYRSAGAQSQLTRQ